jgi:hypothetical protein
VSTSPSSTTCVSAGDEVVLRPGPALARQRDEVVAELLAGPHGGGGGLLGRVELVHAADVGRPRAQQVPVGLRDAEHLGDHRHGQRLGDGRQQVELPLLERVVDEPVGDLLHRAAQPLDRARGERPADEAPQPRVVGRFDVEHPAADHPPERRVLRRLLRPAHLGVRRDVQVGPPEPPVAQQRVDVGVARTSHLSVRASYCTRGPSRRAAYASYGCATNAGSDGENRSTASRRRR